MANSNYRVVKDIIDGEEIYSVREVFYAVEDMDDVEYDNLDDFIMEISEEPVSMTNGSLSKLDLTASSIRAAIDDARNGEPILDGIEAWHLEHRDTLLYNVHDKNACAGEFCTIHNRSKHSMRSFPQHWRSDAGFMERICPHGIGHPDCDELPENRDRVHGCDGCCSSTRNESI